MNGGRARAVEEARSMRAVVLGGGGLTGRVAVRDLAEGGRFDEIVVADLDAGLASSAAAATGSSKVRATGVDVRDAAAVAKLLAGANVCVNAVQYAFNLTVMEACLTAGVPYLDFGGLFHMTRRQLELDSRYRAKRLLAIPGLGQVPGASNVLVMAATADMPRVESIVIRDGWCDRTKGGPPVTFTWSPSTFLDEMNLPAMVWEDGAFREYPPMSGAELYAFPPPVGPTTVYRTLHSEPATLPDSLAAKGLRHCEWKEGGPGIDVLRILAAVGLGSDRPVEVRGTPVIPRDFLLALVKREKLLGYPSDVVVDDWEVLDMEIRGEGPEGPTTRHALGRFPPKPGWGASATEYAVGICGAIGAEMLAAGAMVGTGVLPPERCVPPGPFRAALERRGVATSITPPESPLPPFGPA
ncbi:MAG: saccharopine dehydrogenase NADP-binding domain-containing protein [Thermoplasmata archaeon]|nr:saccharopine dehydrogenase NADP-binding domain-containing protein [Thermoplasmata archaeon]